MATNLPVNFPIPSEPAVASYNWSDIANGIVYNTFYFTVTSYDDSGTTYGYELSPQTLYSYQLVVTGGATTTKNFDTTAFNTPRFILSGSKVYVEWSLTQSGSGNGYAKFQLKKVSGGTPSNITDQVQTPVNSTLDDAQTGTTVLTISSNVNIAIGDSLRLEVYLYNSAGVTALNMVTNQTKINIPFKLQL